MVAMQGGSEPVVGLFALRTFRVSTSGHLVPLSFIGSAWADGTCIARCRLGHPPPADDCTCGVYSLRDLRDLRLQYWSARRLMAVVALEGLTIEGSKGWRSQAARVVDVWTAPGPRGLPDEQVGLLQRHLPGAAFHTDLDRMLARYPELMPVRRPRSTAFARAARSWWAGLRRPRRPRLPTARRAALWALAVLLLTVALSAVAAGGGSPFPAAQVMAQLAAVPLLFAVLASVCESPMQLAVLLATGASPPLLLTPRRPVLHLWRCASVLLTAGTSAAVLTAGTIPVGGICWSVAAWAVLLGVERFMVALAPSAAPARLFTAPRGAHPGRSQRRDWTPETLTSRRRRGRRGAIPVLITPPPPPLVPWSVTLMADIGEPLRRIEVVPTTAPVLPAAPAEPTPAPAPAPAEPARTGAGGPCR